MAWYDDPKLISSYPRTVFARRAITLCDYSYYWYHRIKASKDPKGFRKMVIKKIIDELIAEYTIGRNPII